jgi:epsilon-lactone hydrolase
MFRSGRKKMSIQSQFLYFIMKNRRLFQFRLKPETWDENTSISAFREMCESVNRKMENKLPAGLDVSSFDLAGMHAEWLLPAGAGKDKVILYTIGGGYVSGTCRDHRTLVAKVAQTSGIAVIP